MYRGEVAVVHEVDRVPLIRAPGAEAVDYEQESLYETLERCGARPARADYAAEAIVADAEQAKLLEVEVGAPILLVNDCAFDATGSPVCLARQNYRGDRYRFRTSLTRRHPSSAIPRGY